jgi:pyridoxal phosphate enzyme (YggS family)
MILKNVDTIRRRIADACTRAGRRVEEVTVVAVSKTFPATAIQEVLQAGVPDIGENYVQEVVQKRELLSTEVVRWHFVGHLQSNKVRVIAPWVVLIHSVESVRLAQEIDRRAQEAGRVLDFLVEVNTTGEGTKFGVRPEETIAFLRRLEGLSHVRVAGLMTIGPFLPDPEGSRPMFRTLRKLRDEAAQVEQENLTMRHLSMGMTGDFEVAIEEGATLVRIGTAIFGPRKRIGLDRRS